MRNESLIYSLVWILIYFLIGIVICALMGIAIHTIAMWAIQEEKERQLEDLEDEKRTPKNNSKDS